MANATLRDTFLTALKTSKSFGLLSKEEQARLIEVFSAAEDEQLQAGMEALNEDAVKQKNLEAQIMEREKQAAKLADEIKETLKGAEKDERKINEEKDSEESSKVADQLLEKIGSAGDDKDKSKRKKFLGIF
jgi:hypothetical protein